MTTTEIIRMLFGSMDSECIQQNDDKIIDLLKIATEKLQELQQLVDDMRGDHYVDYLEFYAARCRELEEDVAYYENVIKQIRGLMEGYE